jgi:predicted enzyme related to lactoylglutathione lyase
MKHFAFTKLVVVDLDAAEAFYTSVFGLTPTHRVHSEIGPRPIDEVMFAATAPGGSTFVLLRYTDLQAPSNDEVIVGFVTDDVDALCERAVQAGGAITREPRDMAEHGVRVGFVTDPEGHLIEVVQQLGAR